MSWLGVSVLTEFLPQYHQERISPIGPQVARPKALSSPLPFCPDFPVCQLSSMRDLLHVLTRGSHRCIHSNSSLFCTYSWTGESRLKSNEIGLFTELSRYGCSDLKGSLVKPIIRWPYLKLVNKIMSFSSFQAIVINKILLIFTCVSSEKYPEPSSLHLKLILPGFSVDRMHRIYVPLFL